MTLYFRQVKFLACIFLVMSIISAPSFILYASGSSKSNYGIRPWAIVSLGNLASSDVACSSTEFPAVKQTQSKLTISCEIGEMQALLDFGLSTLQSKCPARDTKAVGSTTSTAYKQLTLDKCNLKAISADKTSDSARYSNLKNLFNTKCLNKHRCEIDLEFKDLFNQECQDLLNTRQEAL